MKKCVIWGGTDLAICHGLILVNCSDIEFLGSYDKNIQKKNQMIRPIDDPRIILDADVVYTENRIIESVKKSIMELRNGYPEVSTLEPTLMSCQSFIHGFLNVHPSAVGNGSGFARWIVSARRFYKKPISNFVEVGANYSQDANFTKCVLGLNEKNVICFEGNPEIAKQTEELYPYTIVNAIVTNKNGSMKMHLVPEDLENSGLSTVVDYPSKCGWRTEEIKAIRLDKYLSEERITNIDFMKIDVEGMSYEVLEGLGNRIYDVGCIQLEAEYTRRYENHSWKDIVSFLTEKGFVLVDFYATSKYQCDSMWVNENVLDVEVTV